jgi:hypothetical protein
MKTAVEWLQKEVERILKSSLHREQAEQLWESFEEAKEMEKEQIIKAWWESPTMGKYCSAEEYYNTTFKKQEQ